MCKLSRGEAVHVRAAPVVTDKQVMACGQRRDAFVQTLLEQFRIGFPAVCRTTACTTASKFFER